MDNSRIFGICGTDSAIQPTHTANDGDLPSPRSAQFWSSRHTVREALIALSTLVRHPARIPLAILRRIYRELSGPDGERLLREWIASATQLGPKMDPAPVLRVVKKRRVAPAVAELLMPFARVCETTGRLPAAFDAYRFAMREPDHRVEAAEAAYRIVTLLDGADGIREFLKEIAKLYPGDRGLGAVHLKGLSELGEDKAALNLAEDMLLDEPDHPIYLAYCALSLVVDDEEEAAKKFSLIWKSNPSLSDADQINAERCLHLALVRLCARGRDAEAFFRKIRPWTAYSAPILAAARVAAIADTMPQLRCDLVSLLGGAWKSQSIAGIVSVFRRNAIRRGDRETIRRAAFTRPMSQDDSAAFGLLRDAAFASKLDDQAVARLARLNGRQKKRRPGRNWTDPAGASDVSEAVDLWRRLLDSAPEDPILRREYDDARRAATSPILFVGMPRGASVYVYHALIHGLGKTGIGGVMAGAFPNFTLCQEGFQRMMLINGTSHTHLGPTEFNLREIGQRYKLDRMLVHLRDPRQALLSWHDFMPGVITTLDPTQAYHYRLPADYLERSSDQQLDWLVDNWLPVITQWIVGWAKAPDLDYFETQILFTTFEEMKRDQSAFFAKILDFYDIDRDLFTEPVARRGSSNYRQGDTETWRSVVNDAQKQKMREIVPEWLTEKFGWAPT